jgi:hypothetical protein
MQKKFRVLRFIGTLWKVLAWIKLILGILAAIGVLLMGVLGGGVFEQLLQANGFNVRGIPLGASILGGAAGFIVVLVASALSFLILYAMGELIYLALAVEENTRSASMGMAAWMQQQQSYAAPAPQPYPAAPAYPPPQQFAPPPEDYPPPSTPTPPSATGSEPTSSPTLQIPR